MKTKEEISKAITYVEGGTMGTLSTEITDYYVKLFYQTFNTKEK